MRLCGKSTETRCEGMLTSILFVRMRVALRSYDKIFVSI
ncbi:hypothetical protein GNIT_0958 [Glaciecola nitratireducens FR1064]|uniref:Uncharacterized protein n=1 Tax=Glaciecola nitratireducens (strain JCM 12485 / KCTC 12276 / FR1064) TaxID=1085623 RepID=G4QG05_GLANF|nr:hypothetical protein GNIT_0958 [Glaciecola nitratireducens FR1064]